MDDASFDSSMKMNQTDSDSIDNEENSDNDGMSSNTDFGGDRQLGTDDMSSDTSGDISNNEDASDEMEGNDGGSELSNLLSQLSDKDKETAISYIKSLAKNSNGSNGDNSNNQLSQMEAVRVKKSQIKEIWRRRHSLTEASDNDKTTVAFSGDNANSMGTDAQEKYSNAVKSGINPSSIKLSGKSSGNNTDDANETTISADLSHGNIRDSVTNAINTAVSNGADINKLNVVCNAEDINNGPNESIEEGQKPKHKTPKNYLAAINKGNRDADFEMYGPGFKSKTNKHKSAKYEKKSKKVNLDDVFDE